MQHPHRRLWDSAEGGLLRFSPMQLDYPTGYELLGCDHALDSRPGSDSHEVMATVQVCTRLSAVVVHLCSR